MAGANHQALIRAAPTDSNREGSETETHSALSAQHEYVKGHSRFHKPKLSQTAFTVDHYAGRVSCRQGKKAVCNTARGGQTLHELPNEMVGGCNLCQAVQATLCRPSLLPQARLRTRPTCSWTRTKTTSLASTRSSSPLRSLSTSSSSSRPSLSLRRSALPAILCTLPFRPVPLSPLHQ